MTVLTSTQFDGLPLFSRGKVRDNYDLGAYLLIVATDRISAFDVVLPDGIPDKGRVLTQLSIFWFDLLKDVAPNHLVTSDVVRMAELLPDHTDALRRHAAALRGRSMLVHKASVFPVECVVRGYLAGSGWKDYQRTGAVCGIKLPPGLREAGRLPEPIFTPSTKATTGHDENIPIERAAEIVGRDRMERLKSLTLGLYSRAAAYAETRGIILADTKFEFGQHRDRTLVIDEVLTPDSSRFWPAAEYRVGSTPPSFDKQFVRDWLEAQKWNKPPPAPALPAEVISRTREKYLEAFRRLTGRDLPTG